MVGAFYLLSLLGDGEPRGLPGTVARVVRFQQSPHGRPLDDVTIDAIHADGSVAFLDIQVKRTIDFTRSDREFRAVVAGILATSEREEFVTCHYEMAVAIARSSTRIERDCQQVLFWARRLSTSEAFAEHIQRPGFASAGMRTFVDAFRYHLGQVGAPTDDQIVWSLLRRFQILAFDFEHVGSDFEYRALERTRALLAPEYRARASDLWPILINQALSYDSVGGDIDRPDLCRILSEQNDIHIVGRSDLRPVFARLSEAASDALSDIKDDITGVMLQRVDLVEAATTTLTDTVILEIVGPAGVGKSAILKAIASQLRIEGGILVLAPGRIIGGGWLQMAHALGCTISRADFFNELGCGGGATLFIDSIDQIDGPDAWATLGDLLRTAGESQGWRIVVTARADSSEWTSRLPDEVRRLPRERLTIGDMTDQEADILRAANPRLARLLDPSHPARTIARNLFYLSRLMTTLSDDTASSLSIVDEINLAKTWWNFGGGRSDTGKWERLRILRAMGEAVIRSPDTTAVSTMLFASNATSELISAESIREQSSGLNVAFWHDTLRDWTVGFLLHGDPKLIAVLPKSCPLPASLARGLEIAARLALTEDTTSWLTLLSALEIDDIHGSWRRPILLALARSESALALFDRVAQALLANKGHRLRELTQLMIAVETEPAATALARSGQATIDPALIPLDLVVPTGASWMPVVIWLVMNADQLPSALIPDAAKIFQIWLIATRGTAQPIDHAIVARLFSWLSRIESALRPVLIHKRSSVETVDLDFTNLRSVHEDIRMTFLLFCHAAPDLAAQYFSETDHDLYHGAREVLRLAGPAAKVVPEAVADFALAALLPDANVEGRFHPRNRYDYGDAFHLVDTSFVPASPGHPPFFDLLTASPPDGLRLIRGIVGYATQWRERLVHSKGHNLPELSIPFEQGAKSYIGDFAVYQWARGCTGSVIAASALMALEAWGHREIEAGRDISAVLDDVCGPSGSSVAFLSVAVDLVLSHWNVARLIAWPLLAAPELLSLDRGRHTQDISGVGSYFLPEQQPGWSVTVTDLLTRPSRQLRLIDRVGDITVHGPAAVHAKLRAALRAAHDVIVEHGGPEEDPVHGLPAIDRMALQMAEPSNWVRTSFTGQDGQILHGFQYNPGPAELALYADAGPAVVANMTVTTQRLAIQKGLQEPESVTPTLLDQVRNWAYSEVETGTYRPPTEDAAETFDRHWNYRALVMACALLARHAAEAEWSAITSWVEPILHEAATEPLSDRDASYSPHIYSHPAAIAAVGYVALVTNRGSEQARDTLLTLAAHRDHAVINALASHLETLYRHDPRLPRSLARIILVAAVHPVGVMSPELAIANRTSFERRCTDAREQESLFFAGQASEPAWPDLPMWPTRRRHGIPIDVDGPDDSAPDTAFDPLALDGHTPGILISALIRLTVPLPPPWLIAFAQNLMAWTVDANNGPPDGGDDERDNRPFEWNMNYFDFLGVLCVALPFADVREKFLAPMLRLHDEAFCDACASLLRGFDRATLATGTGNPDEPQSVRACIIERLQRTRMLRYNAASLSFTLETHLADAVNAFFYHPSRWASQTGLQIPPRWPGLLDTAPGLAAFAAAFPNAGFIAVTFLGMIETYPCRRLIPPVVAVLKAWSQVHGVGSGFWSTQLIASRICAWIDTALRQESNGTILPNDLREDLDRCLDTLIQSGIPSARLLEAALIENTALRWSPV